MLYLSNPLAISSVMFTPDTLKKKKKWDALEAGLLQETLEGEWATGLSNMAFCTLQSS